MLKRTALAVLVAFGLLVSGCGAGGEQREDFNKYSFSGPYTHANLSVFLIHGKDRIKSKKILTLQEAIKQRKVKVYETGIVSRLRVENLSPDHDLFIKGGEIVKGGKQDRVISQSHIIPPRSGKMEVRSFCVEAGRWSRRRGESLRQFSASDRMIVSKDLKLSVARYKSQGRVWNKISEMQTKLGRSLGSSVRSRRSRSSLQLTLENRKLQKRLKAYLKKLSRINENKTNVLGYAFVINGKINSAELFASNFLFNKLWSKLIKASVVEAVAEYNPGKTYTALTGDDIKTFLTAAEKGKKGKAKDISERVNLRSKESKNNVLYETRDKKNRKKWINKSYINKK